ncbi:bleomycin resistance protein [Deinococcus koreensis]|uniref:Bleomycin resistance protein n=1 Tax=Deinococcus koreensis TaxID=2054903 RepID=A0A2K3V1L3_9DEIO|nr:VOC family protein [Deinococcus koreensis]PNY82682.1 glyoxalase/bleomycin resistance/extradiol dioxygenase family protein [Deinococcus koreensis]
MRLQGTAIPTLPSRSLPQTLAFYQRLGFGGELRGGDTYAVVQRDGVEFHFFFHPELRPGESSAGFYLRVEDVDGVYQDFAVARLPQQGIPRMDALEDKPWGMREFAVVDPDGNLLRIGQRSPGAAR